MNKPLKLAGLLFSVLAFLLICSSGKVRKAIAESGNPTSNILYDSTNVAGTLVERDANGNAVILPVDSSSGFTHMPKISSTVANTAQFSHIGDIFYVTNPTNGNLFAVCTTTGITGLEQIVISSAMGSGASSGAGSAAPCRQSVF